MSKMSALSEEKFHRFFDKARKEWPEEADRFLLLKSRRACILGSLLYPEICLFDPNVDEERRKVFGRHRKVRVWP